MKTFLNHLAQMLPFMVATGIIYMIISLIVNRNSEDTNWLRESVKMLFCMFIVAIMSQTVFPKISFVNGHIVLSKYGHGGINLIPGKVFYQTYYEAFVYKNFEYFLINAVGNILLFMPIGFFSPLLWRKMTFKKVIFVSVIATISIEVMQVFLERSSDIDDVWINTLGSVCGYCIFRIFKHWNRKLVIKIRNTRK